MGAWVAHDGAWRGPGGQTVPFDGGVTPTWRKPTIGASAETETAWNTQDAAYGPMLIRRTYNVNLPSSWATSSAAPDVAAGRHSYWSWKPSVAGFPGSSSQQSAFSAFLDTIPAGHEATIVAWHEPDDDIRDGNYTLAQWGALQDVVGTIIRDKGRPELRFGICLMGPWTFDTRGYASGWDWEGCLDWDLVDVFGIDPYLTTAGSTTSLERILTYNNSGAGPGTDRSTMTFIKSLGKPCSLMEWGKYNDTEAAVAAWIGQSYDWFCAWNQEHVTDAEGRIESAMWFDMWSNPLTGVEIPAYAAIIADSKIPPEV